MQIIIILIVLIMLILVLVIGLALVPGLWPPVVLLLLAAILEGLRDLRVLLERLVGSWDRLGWHEGEHVLAEAT